MDQAAAVPEQFTRSCWFPVCAVCGGELRHMGEEAVRFVNRLGDSAAKSGRIPKGAVARWPIHLLSVTVQSGHDEMHCRSGNVISRDQDLRYDAGFAEPVMMGHESGVLLVAVPVLL